MEGHARHRVPAWLVAVALLLPLVALSTARAEDKPPPYEPGPVDVWVGTGPDQVTVDAETISTAPGGGGTGTQGSGPRCYLRAIPTSEWDDVLLLGYYEHRMKYSPYRVICGDQVQGIVWIPITLGEPGSGAVDPEDIAMRLRDEMPVPRAEIQMNPGQGMVGVESWFWLDGYSGAPVTNSTDAFGRLVEVEARVTHYEWLFGEGSTLISETPGQPYPSRSEVRHVYQRSSAGLTEGYPVDVTFVFAVRYRVDGGAWIEIPGITRQARSVYLVRESQAVIQR